MSVNVGRAAADTYFMVGNHVRTEAWAPLSAKQKDAALAHAARIVSREIGDEVADESVIASSYYRPDYAVFEQALAMMLRTGVIPNAERTGPHYLAVGDEGEDAAADDEKLPDPYALCSEAAAYLQKPRRQIRLSRG